MIETGPIPDAAALVSTTLARLPAARRGAYLRELLAHAAAGIVILEGDKAAAEAAYRLADAVVRRSGR